MALGTGSALGQQASWTLMGTVVLGIEGCIMQGGEGCRAQAVVPTCSRFWFCSAWWPAGLWLQSPKEQEVLGIQAWLCGHVHI